MRSRAGAGAVPHAEPDRLTPADAEMVVTIDVRQLLQTPVVKKHALDPIQVLLKRNDELGQLLTAAGIDPLKDINTLSLSTSGNLATTGKMLAVVRGKFDPDKARTAADEYAKKHPGRLKDVKEGDLSMWEVASDKKPIFAAFAGKNALVMTLSKEDTAAVVKRAGERPQRLNKDMQAALDQLKGGESVWLAMLVTDEIKQLIKSDDNAKDFADALQSITGGLELTDDAQFTLVVHTSNAKAATQIKGKIDELMPLLGFVGAGKDASGRIVKEVINNIKLSTEKNDVSIRLKITDAQIEKARRKVSKKRTSRKRKRRRRSVAYASGSYRSLLARLELPEGAGDVAAVQTILPVGVDGLADPIPPVRVASIQVFDPLHRLLSLPIIVDMAKVIVGFARLILQGQHDPLSEVSQPLIDQGRMLFEPKEQRESVVEPIVLQVKQTQIHAVP